MRSIRKLSPAGLHIFSGLPERHEVFCCQTRFRVPPYRLDPAVEYIKQNCFDKNINIQQIADLCGVSATYFRRIFSDVYGVSPVKYINSLRIKRAKELIASQMYASVSDIALLCGFSDDCYFRKVFKAETMMTPKEFAQLSKKQ